jgi:hypothetical protein
VSFIAPLFLLGAAAIAGPIVLHLIRREAKGQQDFSSLMFLEASPPTMMRKSRLDQWLLLLLRSLAILLMAAAFARPYWPTSLPAKPTNSKLQAILIDRSASMSRPGCMPAAIERAQQIIEKADSQTTLCLYAFDNSVEALLSIDEASRHSPDERRILLLEQLKKISVGHQGTNLGKALTTVAGNLDRFAGSANDSEAALEISLLSDFQAGSDIEQLVNFQWPSQCRLNVEVIETPAIENASASWLATKSTAGPSSRSEASTEKLPIRIAYRGQKPSSVVELQWLNEKGEPIANTSTKSEVSPDDSVVVQIPSAATSARILSLDGDQAIFDNQRWLASPKPYQYSLVCLDTPTSKPAESLGFFLEQLPFGNSERQVTFAWREPGVSASWPDLKSTPLMVASHRLTREDAEKWRVAIEAGQTGLWVLDAPLDTSSITEQLKACWDVLVGDSSKLSEAENLRDAVFGKIDFGSSIFQQLSDPRFNDFTKIRFWSHRKVSLDEASGWTTQASFDDGTPAILSRSIGKGKLWLFTAGWQPEQSQLALSSKFVPILTAIFHESLPKQRPVDQLHTGDQIIAEAGETWIDPKGESITEKAFTLEFPGFYQVQREQESILVACNLPLSESDTRLLDIERLERLGVQTKVEQNAARAQQRLEQQQSREQEKKQRLWRYFFLSLAGILSVESLLLLLKP